MRFYELLGVVWLSVEVLFTANISSFSYKSKKMTRYCLLEAVITAGSRQDSESDALLLSFSESLVVTVGDEKGKRVGVGVIAV